MKPTDHPDKIKLTLDVLMILRKGVEEAGEKTLKDYHHLRSDEVIEAFEDAVTLLQMAVKESKKIANDASKNSDLLDALKKRYPKKEKPDKSPYNQT